MNFQFLNFIKEKNKSVLKFFLGLIIFDTVIVLEQHMVYLKFY